MIEAALDEYSGLTGIPRQRRYFDWNRHRWVSVCTVDLGRSDGVAPSDLPRVKMDNRLLYQHRGTIMRILDYLLDNGASRPVQISEDLDIPATTVVTIIRRHTTLFVRRKSGGAVWYDIAPIENESSKRNE